MKSDPPKKKNVRLRRLGVLFLILVAGVGGAALLLYAVFSYITIPFD